MNRFKGLDLVDRVPQELWMVVCNIVQEAVTKTIPKKKCKKAKWLSEESLQIDDEAIKKNTFESVLMRWMKLEPITQSEVRQKKKHQYSMLMHIYEI